MSTLPYPGRHESHDSWTRRCDEHYADRERWRRDMASKINNHGGYNYHPVQRGPVSYELPDGSTVTALWVGKGNSHQRGADAFSAKTPGTRVIKARWPGNGWTARTDWVVVAVEPAAPAKAGAA